MNATNCIGACALLAFGAMSLTGCSGDSEESEGGGGGACFPAVEVDGRKYVERPTDGLERAGALPTQGVSPCSDTRGPATNDQPSRIALVSLKGIDTRIAVASARPTPGGGVYVIEGRCYGLKNAHEISDCIRNPLYFAGELYVAVKLGRTLTTEGVVGAGRVGLDRRVRVWKVTNVPIQYALAITPRPRQIYVDVNRCNLPGLAPDFEKKLILCLSSEPD